MHPGAATNSCHAAGGVRSAASRVAALLALAACASAPARLTDDQVARCRAVEAAYRASAADYPQQRDALAADPIAAQWLTRMFIAEVVRTRENRPVGDEIELARTAPPAEVRAMDEIRQLGSRAVPTVVDDLLRSDQPLLREFGIELLARIGQPAVAAVQQVARDGEPRQRRAAARTLGRLGVDDAAFATLRELVADGDYTVRADALRGLRDGGPRAEALLVEHLHADSDPFVRRVAAETLAQSATPRAAEALVDYLERCKRESDWPGEKAAQASLQQLAGTRAPRSAPAWRAWLAEYAAKQGAAGPR